jgi:hypothetical protein
MNNKMLTVDEIVRQVVKILDKIIIENSESLSQGDYLVRPGYGYDKFYLNHVDGSFDLSLYSLIHWILYEEKIYKNFLNEKHYRHCLDVIKNNPEAIYSPGGNSIEDNELQDVLDSIYFKSIVFVGKKMNSMELEGGYYFRDYLNDSEKTK